MEQKAIKDSVEFMLGQMTAEIKLLRIDITALHTEFTKNQKLTYRLNKKVAAMWTAGTLLASYLIQNPKIILNFFKP